MSLKRCATDSSPYVRKTAAIACGKILQIDNDAKSELVDVISQLLGDLNTQVLSSAIAAYSEVCPDNIELLHPHYRKICNLLADLDDWGQIAALNVLTRYARLNFSKPSGYTDSSEYSVKASKPTKKKAFYSSDEESEEEESEESDEEEYTKPTISEDHALLLKVASPLLRSRNSGVVLAVASLYFYIGFHDKGFLIRAGKALVSTMKSHREIQYIVLKNIVGMAKKTPEMFRPYLKSFFIAESEPAFVRSMKLDVLAEIVDSDNINSVLREFTRYVKDDDKEFVKQAINVVVRIANSLPEVADKCLRGLMGLISTDNEAVVAEAVVAIRQLLQQNPHHDGLIVRLARRLNKITSPAARAATVWVIGEFQSKPRVAAMAPDALRQLAKGFRSESGEVKAQIIALAVKTALWQPDSKPVKLLLRYVLDLARYDSDYDLRDRARLLRYLTLGDAITQLDAAAVEEAGSVIRIADNAVVADSDCLAAEVSADAVHGASSEQTPGVVTPKAEIDANAEVDNASQNSHGTTAADSVADAPTVSESEIPSDELSSPPEVLHDSTETAKSEAGATAAVRLADRVRAVVLATKPPPSVAHALSNASNTSEYTLGSLSFTVGHTAKGYLPVPEWTETPTSSKVRDPVVEESSSRKKPSKFSRAGASAYDSETEDDSEYDSEEDSDEETDSDEEDTDSEEDSDEDDDSNVEDDDEEEDEESEEDESEEEEESEEEDEGSEEEEEDDEDSDSD